jgi:hypothetical protein
MEVGRSCGATGDQDAGPEVPASYSRDEPELAEERSDSLAQVPRPEVSQGRKKHIVRNEVTIGKLQKSVAQV